MTQLPTQPPEAVVAPPSEALDAAARERSKEHHLAFLFDELFASREARTALRHRVDGEWRDISWHELGQTVHVVARGLVSLGVKDGDRVGILAPNRPEWTIADLAIQQVRGVSVPIHATSTSSQTAWILRDAGVKVLFVAGIAGYEKVRSAGNLLPGLEAIVVFDEADAASVPGALCWSELLVRGSGSHVVALDAELEGRRRRMSSEDLLTLLYTSGTTGEPKGVMLTHENLATALKLHDLRLPPFGEGDVSLCFLPLSHVFERTWTYYVLYRGMVNCYCEDPTKVVELLAEVRPTAMCAVPRLYEKIHANVCHRIEAASPIRRRLFAWALGVGAEAAARRRDERPLHLWLRLRHALADRLVLAKVRAIVGGRVRMMPCAGAAISRDIEDFFHAAGVFLCQGYGLTETTATVTCQETTQCRTGTV
jgi:long-chain acyl-CoA synthetase